ncbi:S8 family serine peptidase [Runella sp.]|uniref:S8 family serine peptidase n=1 Tax=Runella sp. TaxID=1960881 RepID=UPI003D1271F6
MNLSFGQPEQQNRLRPKEYLIITLKKGVYIKTDLPEFKKSIQENGIEYEKIQQKYFQLTKLKSTDTLDINEYAALNKALHVEQFPLRCAYSLKNINTFYDKLVSSKSAKANRSNRSVCSIDNLALTFTACYYDGTTLDEIRAQLDGIATVYAASTLTHNATQSTALVNSCQTVSSAAPMHYQNLMRIKPTLWGSGSWAYGKKANMVIIESQGDTTYNHCELNHRTGLNLVNLSAEGSSYSHYYWTLGTLIADHKKKLSTVTDCLGIVPKVGINGVILINEEVTCNQGTTNDISKNNRYNALLEGINRANGGDVLLMAFQTDAFRPVDEDSNIKILTKIAVECLKIIIVEAAGNGSERLTIADNSGAIIVAAAQRSGSSYVVESTSNYGTRINCFAPGYLLNVPDIGGGYSNYCCTSEAATIMAGVIAGLQSRYKATKGRFFTPQEIISAIDACNTPINGKKVYDNSGRLAQGKRIPFADKLWEKLP